MTTVGAILSDLNGYVDRVARLFQLDAILLSIETKQNLRAIIVSVALLAAAAAIAFFGAIALLAALILFIISLGLAPSLSALIVGVALLVIAAALAFVGMGRIKRWSPTPKRAIRQFQQNIQTLKASLRNEPRTNS